jgi:hypothetical protein
MANYTGIELEQIKVAATSVIDIVLYEAAKVDATDNPEYLASEIIALVEWSSRAIAHNGAVAQLVLNSYPWPNGVGVEVKAQFNLPY